MYEKLFSGKVRDTYDLHDGTLVVVTTDRISAFDSVLPSKIEGKGVVLNKMSAFWFGLTGKIVKNHMITIDNKKMPKQFQTEEFDGRCMMVKKLQMLPIECIVRGYITGSGWESYQKTGAVCGIKLPAGLQESERLPKPIYTPTTKAVNGHDEHISYEETVKLIGDESLARRVRNFSIAVYCYARDYANKRGIIIADTKFEFGVDENGNLMLADEVITPDSSRFWPADKYEVGRAQVSYDKQYLRDWLSASGWDKNPPAPELPKSIVTATRIKYQQAYEALIK